MPGAPRTHLHKPVRKQGAVGLLVYDAWMADFLKTLGGAAAPLPDDWDGSRHPGFGREFVASRRGIRAITRGDRIAYYAAGWQVVFAWGNVTSVPYEQDSDEWPWRVDVELERSVKLLHEGLPLRQVPGHDGRNLMISVRSKSHFRLDPDEFEAIKANLRSSPTNRI
jgi:EVE domain